MRTSVPPEPVASPCNVVVIDYGLGNVRSVVNALEAVGARACVSNRDDVLQRADALVLPGVGAFGDGMENLCALGLVDSLSRLVLDERKPFLGICLGMQLIARKGYENGEFAGLGWLDAEVVRFSPRLSDGEKPLKVPHVGWNDVSFTRDSFAGTAQAVPQSFYFVHSYYMECAQPDEVVAHCDYGVSFPAMVQRGNICAVQCHPEKSQTHGLSLLRSFLAQAVQWNAQQSVHHA